MFKYLLLLLLPISMLGKIFLPPGQSIYLVVPGEYKCYVKNPVTGALFEVTSNQNVPGAPTGIIDGSASIHHAVFIGPDSIVYVIGDNPSNISGTGSKLATLPFTKTPVGHAKSVVAYDNNGVVGYGELIVTNDGKVILLGASQSGFRGDGTEGNAAEPIPYTVPLPKPIKKVVAGTYAFALSTDSLTVYRWGGTRASGGTYWAQYSSGAGVANPDLTHIGTMTFGEPIVDIIGGGDWSYAIGKSGKWYGWAYDTHFLGLNTPSQLKPFTLSNLNFPSPVLKSAVGPEATYSLLTNGELYAWGDNMQGAIGNGTEGVFTNFSAPWGVKPNSPWILTPYKVNPTGVLFINVFTSIGDAFYVYAEDSNHHLWVWGRNKGFVLWNGQGGTSQDQSDHPNKWDVLSPLMIPGFGTVVVTPPPPTANIPPAAVISTILTLAMPNDTIVLDGSGSKDSDGRIVSYAWKQLSGPLTVAGKIDSTITTYYGIGAGVYTFQLSVTDDRGATGVTTMSVTILPYTVTKPRNVSNIILKVNGQTFSVSASMFSTWIQGIDYDDGSHQ